MSKSSDLSLPDLSLPDLSLPDLSLLLARRQKRLIYWKERFSSKELSEAQVSRCRDLFSTFSLLMMKVLKASNEEERNECEERLESLEQELNNLFSSRRLMTSSLGGAITNEPEPGEAGH